MTFFVFCVNVGVDTDTRYTQSLYPPRDGSIPGLINIPVTNPQVHIIVYLCT